MLQRFAFPLSVAALLLSADAASAQFTFPPSVNYPTPGLTISVAAADLDDDTFVDLAVANQGGTVMVFWNNGTGSFPTSLTITVPSGYRPIAIDVADLNQDNRFDLIVSSFDLTFDDVLIYRNTGSRTFAAAQQFPADLRPVGAAAGDLDGDGDQDLGVVNFRTGVGNGSVSFLRNLLVDTGAFGFAPPVNTIIGGNSDDIAIGDFDGVDGLDLAASNDQSSNVSVLLNNGVGGFTRTDFAASFVPTSVEAADIDRDGTIDLATSDRGATDVGVLWGNGDGTFQSPVDFPAGFQQLKVIAADLNCDGLPDLVTANTHPPNNLSLLKNNGSRTFAAPQFFSVGMDPRGVAAANLDGQNSLDLASANNLGNSLSVLLNATCKGCTPAPGGMVAWWPLNETSGTNSQDVVGGHHGTRINGPMPSPGVVSGALGFDGVDDHIAIPHHPALDFGNRDFSVDAWVHFAGFHATHHPIVSKDVAGRGYTLYVTRQQQLALIIEDGFASYIAPSSLLVPMNTWSLVAVTADADATGLKLRVNLYIDGAPAGSRLLSLTGSFANTAPLWIGRDSFGDFAKGRIDEVELFDRVLSAGEIQQVHGAQALGKCKPCIGKEKIKKISCQKGKLKVKTVGAAGGANVTGVTSGACGIQTKTVTAKPSGSATLKFGGCAAGPGSINVIWECGASETGIYACTP